jgi:hypothetical protein
VDDDCAEDADVRGYVRGSLAGALWSLTTIPGIMHRDHDGYANNIDVLFDPS